MFAALTATVRHVRAQDVGTPPAASQTEENMSGGNDSDSAQADQGAATLPEVTVEQEQAPAQDEQQTSAEPQPQQQDLQPAASQSNAAAQDYSGAPAGGGASVSEFEQPIEPSTLRAEMFDGVDDKSSTSLEMPELEVLEHPGNTIGQKLGTEPGVAQTGYTAGASRPVLRGLGGARVRMQEGGTGIFDASALSEDHAVASELLNVEGIRVERGPGTLRYSNRSVGGMVVIDNGQIPDAIPENGVEGSVKGSYSSVDEGWDGAFSTTAGSGGVVVHGEAARRRADDYDTPEGRLENSFVERDSAAIGASLIGLDGFAGIAISAFESTYGIAGEDARIELENYKLSSKGEWRVNSKNVSAIRYWFGASDYEHVEIGSHGHGEEEHDDHDDHDHEDEHADEDEEEIGSQFTNRAYEGRLEIESATRATRWGFARAFAGLQIQHQRERGQSYEGDSLLEPATTESAAGYVFHQLAVSDRLRFDSAVRLEHVSVDGVGREFGVPGVLATALSPAARDRSFMPVSASISAVQTWAEDAQTWLTVSYTERAPTAAELYSNGVHEATETFEIGDPNLEKERGVSIEAGLAQTSGAFRYSASLYYNHYDSFVFKQLTGITCGETFDSCGSEDELDLTMINQQEANFYGFEGQFELDVARIFYGMWGIDGRYDFVHAKLGDGEYVPRLPPHRLGGGIYYRDANWYSRVGILHAFAQNRIGENETRTDDYTLLSAELSRSWETRDLSNATRYTVGIRGDNLLDQEVRNHVSFRKDEVLEPGASVRLFGSVNF